MRPLQAQTKLNKVALTVRTIVGLASLAVAAGIYQGLAMTKEQTARLERSSSALPVQIIVAQTAPVTRTWVGYGAARAMTRADIASEISGIIIERPSSIEAGAPVRKGDLLMQIDPTEYERVLTRVRQTRVSFTADLEALDIEEASTRESLAFAVEAVDLTQGEIVRLREAAQRGAATQTEIDRLMRDLTRFRREAEDIRQRVNLIPSRRASLQAKIATEEANEALAELEVARTTIVAPFDGILQSVDTEVGERVARGEVVARLMDLSRLEAPLQTPVSAGGSVRVGDEVAVSSDNQSRIQWTGRIARISPDADPESRTIAVYVEIMQDPEAAQTLLRPGQFIVGRIAAGGADPRIIVPRRAVDGDRVFVIDDEGNAQPRPVTVEHFLDESRPEIASSESQWAVISEGLQAGDRVIISNIEDLESGLPVDSTEAANAAAPS